MTRFRMPGPLYWGLWVLAGLYNFLQFGLGPQWPVALVFTYSHFLTWSVLGLAVLPLTARYPLGRQWRHWAFHLLAGSLFTLADIGIGHLIFARLTGVYAGMAFPELMLVAFKSCFHLGLVTYWGFIGSVHAHAMQQTLGRRQLQLAEQQTALVRAQLHNLKTQLQPHFLFNTLHSIGSTMHYDLGTAERMLARLGELLRRCLQDAGTATVSLRQELEYVQAYLDIERIRLEERLRIVRRLPDALLDHPVPPFILQPLVENAIKYGIGPRTEGGTLTLAARLDGDELVLEVADDAPEPAPAQKGFGIGLRNTRERLNALYGDSIRFQLTREQGHTVARVRLPLDQMTVEAPQVRYA